MTILRIVPLPASAWLPATCLLAVGLWLTVGTGQSQAQNSSIFQPEQLPEPVAPGLQGRSLNLNLGAAGAGWSDVPPPGVRKLRINDRIMVRVDELSRVQSEGEIQSRKDQQYDAVLTDWIKLIGLKAIKPARQADGDPRVAGQLRQLFRAEGDMQTRDSLALNITCTVADIRPNGDVVLEGHKQIQVNYESWEVSLSGICRYQDIGPDNTVLSRQIANLKIVKRDRGHVRDSYKRGWLTRWIDEWSPF